jgi:hypothetical protein
LTGSGDRSLTSDSITSRSPCSYFAADFDYRASMLRQFPETFSVPNRYGKPMMTVADLGGGEPGSIVDALEAAWRQRNAD